MVDKDFKKRSIHKTGSNMAGQPASSLGDSLLLKADALEQLFQSLSKAGYVIYGPAVADEVIVYNRLESPHALPIGVTDEQQPGSYRLKKRHDSALFGYRVAMQSFKKFLYPPTCTLWKASRQKKGFVVSYSCDDVVGQAFVGVRPCELSAIQIQDRILTEGVYCDEDYRARRQKTFIVAVNCTEAGNTCFCTSMGTGPRAKTGFDLCLTEILADGSHCFLVEVGSDAGIEIASTLPCDKADQNIIELADNMTTDAANRMGRAVDTTDLQDLLNRNLDNVYWDKVGRLCLSCSNCTLVCPTCFCFSVEDTTDLKGENATRVRRWDSCFTADFSYIHGGSVRPSTKARYRQWATHKLGNWHTQFGTTGCVGCGRCITWCPAEIDITEVARALRERDLKPSAASHEKEVKDANT